MAETVVQLAPGESKEVLFEAIANEVRAYRVVIDGLEGSFVATQPPGLILGYKNPKQSSTHWHVRMFDIANKRWSADYLPEPIGSLKAFPDLTPGEFLLVFKESYNVFFNQYVYGPFLLPISGLGTYTWNAQTETLNGLSGVCLPKSSNRSQAVGTITSKEQVTGGWEFNLNLETAEGVAGYVNAGRHFVGGNIRIKTSENMYILSGQVSLLLEMRIRDLNGGLIGYEYDWWATNIKFATGWPPQFFNFSASAWTLSDVYWYDEGFLQGPYESFHARVYSNAGLSRFAVGMYVDGPNYGNSFSYPNRSNGSEISNSVGKDGHGWGTGLFSFQVWAHPEPSEVFDRPDYASQRGWVRVA